jgi:hypothetical protein
MVRPCVYNIREAMIFHILTAEEALFGRSFMASVGVPRTQEASFSIFRGKYETKRP